MNALFVPAAEQQFDNTKHTLLSRYAKEAKIKYEQEKNKCREQELLLALVQQQVQRQEEELGVARSDFSNLRQQIARTTKEIEVSYLMTVLNKLSNQFFSQFKQPQPQLDSKELRQLHVCPLVHDSHHTVSHDKTPSRSQMCKL